MLPCFNAINVLIKLLSLMTLEPEPIRPILVVSLQHGHGNLPPTTNRPLTEA